MLQTANPHQPESEVPRRLGSPPEIRALGHLRLGVVSQLVVLELVVIAVPSVEISRLWRGQLLEPLSGSEGETSDGFSVAPAGQVGEMIRLNSTTVFEPEARSSHFSSPGLLTCAGGSAAPKPEKSGFGGHGGEAGVIYVAISFQIANKRLASSASEDFDAVGLFAVVIKRSRFERMVYKP